MWDNTFLWLSSDNGGDNPLATPTPAWAKNPDEATGLASNYPLLGRKCLSWEGGTRTFAFVSGGLIPPARRGTTNNQLMHIADWYSTFSTLAGIDPSDHYLDPATKLEHNVVSRRKYLNH